MPAAGNMQLPQAITPDGRRLLYMARKETNGTQEFDLFSSELAVGGKGKPFAATEFSEFAGSFSPDGKWLAYGSNESGTAQVYVQAFPDPGRKWQISTEGGNQPIWSRDGATIYYFSARGSKLMRVAVKTAPSFDAEISQELFPVALAQAAGAQSPAAGSRREAPAVPDPGRQQRRDADHGRAQLGRWRQAVNAKQ